MVATALALLVAGLAGFRLAKYRDSPQRKVLQTISELTPENLRQRAPQTDDKLARAALVRLWALTAPVVARQRQLLDQNGELQGFELAVKVAEDFPSSLNPHDRWVATVMSGDAGLILPFWLDSEMPCMAAPLLDAQGQRIGIVALTSRRRPAYTAEDGAFLRTVIGHAALAIQNATMYEFIDTLARVDPLTGLANRREFDRLLLQEVARSRQSGQSFSLIMADLDHFKQVNDRFGHQEGDRALQQIGRLIQQVPKRATDAAFRIGGEEFAVLMGNTDKTGAVGLSETLRGVTEGARFLPTGEAVTISLGVATFPGDGQDAATLIAAADRALYQAKTGGRNRVAAA